MSMKNTLIILGAGATKDFCDIFPLGSELIKDINYHFLTELKFPKAKPENGIYLSPMMNEIETIFSCGTSLLNEIKNRIWNIQLAYEFNYLRNNEVVPTSIDRFIQNELENQRISEKAVPILKYSICYLIKGSEQALSEGDHKLKKNWIKLLVNKLSKYPFEEILNNLKIINFNYDRVFEKYFSDYAQIAWPEIRSEQIQFFLSSIISAYGTLGSLKELPFCLPNDQTILMKDTYHRIKLVDERTNRPINIDNCEEIKQVHFIGFGYDKTNLEKINIIQFSKANLSGSAYLMGKEASKSIEEKYKIKLKDYKCYQFIETIDI